ncbi:MFS transporter [Acetobacteraceae bacterium]|nr:MFS transporter [Acetobacteraceae bacterium]
MIINEAIQNLVKTVQTLWPWRAIIFAAFAGWLLDASAQTLLLFVMPNIMADLHASMTAMGSILFAQAIGRMGGSIAGGWFADRYGRKPTFLISILLIGIFTGLTGLSQTVPQLILAQCIFGLGFGAAWTASATLLMESVPPEIRDRASALMMLGYEFGYLCSAGVQAILLPLIGWRLLFLSGVFPFFLGLFIYHFLSESPKWQPRTLSKQNQREIPNRKTAFFQKFLPASLFATSYKGAAWQAIIVMATIAFSKAAILAFFPTILKTEHGWSPADVFWPVSLYCVGSIIGKLLSGFNTGRKGMVPIFLICLIVSGLISIPYFLASNFWIILLSAFVIGLAASGVFAIIPAYLSLRFPDAYRGSGIGWSNAAGAIGQGTASKLVPFAALLTGVLSTGALYTTFLGLGFAIFFILFRPRLPQN